MPNKIVFDSFDPNIPSGEIDLDAMSNEELIEFARSTGIPVSDIMKQRLDVLIAAERQDDNSQ